MAKIKADFSKVEDGGSFRFPEGDYRVKITGSEAKNSSNDNQMIVWTYEILDGKFAGKTIKDRTVLTPRAMWRLKKLIEATGQTVPKRVVNFDTRAIHRKKLGITVADREYEDSRTGKTRITSDVKDYIDFDAVGAASDDDDEPKKGKKGKKNKKAPDPEPVKKGKGKKGKGKKGKKKGKGDEIESIDLDDAFGS